MPAAADLTSATTKVRRRLIPFLFLLYIVAYLDRINVGFAALQMNQALGFSATTYGLGAGIFFLSYVAVEIPSNIILARFLPEVAFGINAIVFALTTGLWLISDVGIGASVIRSQREDGDFIISSLPSKAQI